MLTTVLVVLFLILLNGVFAMAEIAIVSSKRARLAQMAESGNVGARHAISLSSEPTRFFSSVQVGITTIGILNGAIGEASIAKPLQTWLEQTSLLAPWAGPLSLVIMVSVLTYLSLVFGELVPKRLAITHPEAIASVIARPMELLAAAGRPLVRLLSLSTDGILRMCGVRQGTQPGVTVEEIRVLLEQGAEEGVFEPGEHQMMSNVLDLDDRRVSSVLTPRADVVFLDVRDSTSVNRVKIQQCSHAVLPLCDGGLDHILGFVRSTRVLEQLLQGGVVDLPALAEAASYVPETMTLGKLLEQFKRTHLSTALVIDEFGDVAGLVSFTDVISSIVGEVPTTADDEPMIVRRDDGSWLMDGKLDLDTLLRTLEDDSLLSEEDRQHYHTLGGLAMLAIGQVPRIGDVFQRGPFRFEIVDMDGNRVDRVLVSRSEAAAAPALRDVPL